MPVTQDMLVTELQNLLRLTAFEQTIATIRRTQARTTALEEELTANVQKARERGVLLVQAIRTPAACPTSSAARSARSARSPRRSSTRCRPCRRALLGDLTLEHQLRERTRYARTLAESLEAESVLPVLDRLETAHTATIDWLEERLGEVARTGTSLLRATPLQAAVGTARRIAAAPLGVLAGGVNQASALLWKKHARAGQGRAGHGGQHRRQRARQHRPRRPPRHPARRGQGRGCRDGRRHRCRGPRRRGARRRRAPAPSTLSGGRPGRPPGRRAGRVRRRRDRGRRRLRRRRDGRGRRGQRSAHRRGGRRGGQGARRRARAGRRPDRDRRPSATRSPATRSCPASASWATSATPTTSPS